MEDEESQKKGVCCVEYCSKSFFQVEGFLPRFTDVVMRTGKLVTSTLPFRYSSFHICYDDPAMHYLVQGFRVAAGRDVMLRIRSHVGKQQELSCVHCISYYYC